MILVGYDSESSNYRLYDPVTKHVSVSRHVTFNERGIGTSSEISKSENELTLPLSIPDDTEEEEEGEKNGNEAVVSNAGSDDTAAANRQPEREAKGVQGDEDEIRRDGQQQQEEATQRTLRNREMLRPPERYALYTEYSVPTTYEEAITCPEAAQWTEAIKYELGAHRKNETWEIVKRVPGSKTIDSKWVFKILRNTTGNVFKFKARLCARGFMQREGVDYSETFSPVVRYDSLRVLLAVITQDDLDMIQFDVRTAFLHGILDEDILMEVLTGLQVSNETGGQEYVVCRLKKSIYGLKQAPRCWNLKFKGFLKRFNLRETNADKCIFFGTYERFKVHHPLFVDDGIVSAKSSKVINSIVKALNENFEITHGDCSNFVGMQICRDRVMKTMFIHQSAYAKKVIERFGIS